jgi:predicted CoA-binding protein
MSDKVSDFVNQRRWAVVGVSNDTSKFGRRIYEDMRRAGYDVVPVHATLTELDDGTPVYKSVKDIPEPVAVVDLVIPPVATTAVVRDCIEAGITRVWFQPGAQSAEAIALAEANGLAVIKDGECCMVEKRRW